MKKNKTKKRCKQNLKKHWKSKINIVVKDEKDFENLQKAWKAREREMVGPDNRKNLNSNKIYRFNQKFQKYLFVQKFAGKGKKLKFARDAEEKEKNEKRANKSKWKGVTGNG